MRDYWDKMTPEEAYEKRSKGGKKGSKVRRDRKKLAEELLVLLATDDWQERISLALLVKAASGDVQAYTTIRDTIGEKPIDKSEIINSDIKITITGEEDEH